MRGRIVSERETKGQASAAARREGGAEGAAPVAIVGFGTAGVNAAIALRRGGYEGSIQAFSDAAEAPYSPIITSYYAGGQKERCECFPWSDEALADLGVEVVEGAVTALDLAARLVRTGQGSFPYAKCVIATGARPVTTGFPAVPGYEPLVLRTMADAERMREAFERPECRRVLVSGASMVALKCAEAALARGLAVTLVGMADHVLDMSALPVAAERFERGLRRSGMELRLGQVIEAVVVGEGVDGHCLEVRFSDGSAEGFDEVVVAHGVRPSLGFLEPGALEADRGLLVDGFMRTSDEDVYAAGDVAQALELVSGERRVLGIWKTAALQGAVAGAAIAAELAGCDLGPELAYPGAIAANTIAVDGTLFISGGESAQAAGRTVEVREDDALTVACIFDEAPDGSRRLVGYNVVADADEPGGVAYDTAAMLSLRIEAACRR